MDWKKRFVDTNDFASAFGWDRKIERYYQSMFEWGRRNYGRPLLLSFRMAVLTEISGPRPGFMLQRGQSVKTIAPLQVVVLAFMCWKRVFVLPNAHSQ